MKRTMKRLVSTLLIFAIVFSLLASFSLTAGAATYTYNTGKRGTVCTSLSSKASAYYTGSYTYSTLAAQSASTLKANLKTLMTSTQTKVTSYNEIRTLTCYSDANAGSSSQITLLYTSNNVSGAWDNGVTWNREHVWPQSLGTFTTSNAGSDLHHLRPADPKVNATRGNLPYGEVTGSGTYNTAKTSAGSVGGYYNSTYFEPLDNVKGDIARILLYVYVRWGETNLTEVCQSTDMLLQWMKDDPVDTWEMGRNDAVQSIEGNRNVFIDYPEFAWLILGKSVPSGMTTPSGSAGSSSSGSGSSSTTTTKYVISWGKASASTGSGTIAVTANGSSITSGSSVAGGSTIKVTLTPASGSTVSSLTHNGSAVSVSNNSYSFTLSKNASLVVTWGTSSSTVQGRNSETEVTLPFTDVSEGDWYYEYVKYVYTNNIMSGITETQFAPNVNLKRAEWAAALYAVDWEPQVTYTAKFTDVSESDWYAKAVIWASNVGVVNGMGDGTFAPNNNITREQLAVMLYRYANYIGYDTSKRASISAYSDASSVSSYATEAMRWAVAEGIINGKTATTLVPQGNATRAECATMIVRFLNTVYQ
ncbi:MAG: endonuclease [Faecousia sp.]